jgi:hypothetical protein
MRKLINNNVQMLSCLSVSIKEWETNRNKLNSDLPVPKSHLHLSQELALHSIPF